MSCARRMYREWGVRVQSQPAYAPASKNVYHALYVCTNEWEKMIARDA